VRPDQRVSQLIHAARDARTWAAGAPIGTRDALALLREGQLEIVGRVRDASNVVLYCSITPPPPADATGVDDEGARGAFHVAYKPIRGERPLDDFPPHTLAAREEAAWWVSEALGWAIVPPTLVRDGPAGPGAVQLWIDTDDREDVLRMILVRDERLRAMAVFDVLVNNADRKGGHLLVTDLGEVHGVDHGICFAAEPKLRTVLWGWRGEPLTDAERSDIERMAGALDGELGERLASLLHAREVEALHARATRLLADGQLPLPDPYRHIIPWPPF
jgi:uncharacterized repeat protein (TIGR03843 family)